MFSSLSSVFNLFSGSYMYLGLAVLFVVVVAGYFMVPKLYESSGSDKLVRSTDVPSSSHVSSHAPSLSPVLSGQSGGNMQLTESSPGGNTVVSPNESHVSDSMYVSLNGA